MKYRSRMVTPLADPLSTVIYDKSVFKQFFENNDPQVLAWALNVLEKLYEPGIVPYTLNGITRQTTGVFLCYNSFLCVHCDLR